MATLKMYFRDNVKNLFILQSPWLLMASWHKEPGHQQRWYWPSSPRIFWFQYQKGSSDQTIPIWAQFAVSDY